jgi:hypothetical protein
MTYEFGDATAALPEDGAKFGLSRIEMTLPRIAAFDGLSGVYQDFMRDIAGACAVPLSRLTGRATVTEYGTELFAAMYAEACRKAQDRAFAPLRRHLEWFECRRRRAGLYASRRVKPWKHKGRRMKP